MRGTHDGAWFMPIEDHRGVELRPLLAYEQTAQRTIDEWPGVGMKEIKPITGIIGSRWKKQKNYFLPLE